MHGSCKWSQFIRSSVRNKCFCVTLYLPEFARFETDLQDRQRPAPKRCFSQEFHHCGTSNPSKHASYIKYLLCNMYHSIFTLTQGPAKSGSHHGGLQRGRTPWRPPPDRSGGTVKTTVGRIMLAQDVRPPFTVTYSQMSDTLGGEYLI